MLESLPERVTILSLIHVRKNRGMNHLLYEAKVCFMMTNVPGNEQIYALLLQQLSAPNVDEIGGTQPTTSTSRT